MVGCGCVFHFQANADVRRGAVRRRIDLDQNTIATWNVLEAIRINEIKYIVFAK
jgi:UDP-glucose 4-epimerase